MRTPAIVSRLLLVRRMQNAGDRGKQVSLCYITIIDAPRFAAAAAALVWTPGTRVDDQEKPDGRARF